MPTLNATRDSGRRPLGRALAAAACLAYAGAGCVVVPIPHPESPTVYSRRPITDQETQFIRSHSTTREDVLLRLGEPDLRWMDDQVLGYGWTTSRVLWISAAYGGGSDAYEQPINHFLLVGFDGTGHVTRLERAEAPPFKGGEAYARELRGRWAGAHAVHPDAPAQPPRAGGGP